MLINHNERLNQLRSTIPETTFLSYKNRKGNESFAQGANPLSPEKYNNNNKNNIKQVITRTILYIF